MEDTEENSSTRPSQLPLPSRYTSPGKGLTEISESQTNVRTFASKMPPPKSMKHKLVPAYYEPEPKRKTLAERAGEPNSIAATHANSRPVVKGTTLVGAAKASHIRNPSLNSSISSRPPSSSRHTSNSSFSSSVGPSMRPKSAYGSRPQTSMSFSKSAMGRPISKSGSRPATSMAHHYEEQNYDEEMPSQGKGKGMQPLTTAPSSVQSSQGYSALPVKKSRGRQSACAPQASGNDIRDISVSTAMSRLRIDEGPSSLWVNEYQAISKKSKPASTPGSSQKALISTGLGDIGINNIEKALVPFQAQGDSSVAPKTPSHIPVLSKSGTMTTTPATPSRTPKVYPQTNNFLTKSSNIPGFKAWDVDIRLEEINSFYKTIEALTGTNVEHFEETMGLYKSRIAELETLRSQLLAANEIIQSDLEASRQRTDTLQERLLNKTTEFNDQLRAHRHELDESRRAYRDEIDELRRELANGADRLSRAHQDEVRELERRATVDVEDRIRELERRHDTKLDEERSRRLREVQNFEVQIATERQQQNFAIQKKELDNQNLRGELEDVKGDLAREQALRNEALRNMSDLKAEMQENGAQSTSMIHSLEATISSLSARIHFLESGSKAQSDSFADMEARLQQAVKFAEESKQKLIKEETLRRLLFNQVQELKGNIRVMCRVRPVFNERAEGESATLTFPDNESEAKELEILGREERSSLGTVSRKTHSFTFDRVFGPQNQNREVFEEISQLVQSALDGYNVCIFCYGQTGSGKTHTMSSEDGMIPRATHQIYETATSLKEKGWEYVMEGSFIEVYNEEIHDLLGSSKDFDKKKHEIKHDEQKKQTVVTGLKTVPLDSPDTVESILKHAAANRSVAATKSNERSSRSHSVFILKLAGRNIITGETSEGTLNLVDLAGSERLKQSGAEGDRMKETQNINKSLSCLGDVIAALGQGREGGHIPYRNSKLTYLLQYSLGGNSKTLMFVMASPLEEHLSETLTSLKFATKVHNTHIGTAKKTTKMRERGDA